MKLVTVVVVEVAGLDDVGREVVDLMVVTMNLAVN